MPAGSSVGGEGRRAIRRPGSSQPSATMGNSERLSFGTAAGPRPRSGTLTRGGRSALATGTGQARTTTSGRTRCAAGTVSTSTGRMARTCTIAGARSASAVSPASPTNRSSASERLTNSPPAASPTGRSLPFVRHSRQPLHCRACLRLGQVKQVSRSLRCCVVVTPGTTARPRSGVASPKRRDRLNLGAVGGLRDVAGKAAARHPW